MIDCKLIYSDNVDLIFKKANQRLFLLWKLGEFSASQLVLQRVHTSLNRITRMAGKIKGSKQKSVDQLNEIEKS